MSGYVEVLNPDDITRIWKAIHDAVKLSHAATEVLTPGGGQALLIIPRFFVCALGRSTEAWTYLTSGPGRVDMDTLDITFPPNRNRSTADATFPRTLSGISGTLRGLSGSSYPVPDLNFFLFKCKTVENFEPPPQKTLEGDRKNRMVFPQVTFSSFSGIVATDDDDDDDDDGALLRH
jgi:hypothetical protein